MKEIKYKNKTIKLPFADADYGIDPLEEVTIVAMPEASVDKYDYFPPGHCNVRFPWQLLIMQPVAIASFVQTFSY